MLRLSAMKPRSMCVRAMAQHKRGPLVPISSQTRSPLAVLPKRMFHASIARGRCSSPLGVVLLMSHQVRRHAKLHGVQKLAIKPNLGDENSYADPRIWGISFRLQARWRVHLLTPTIAAAAPSVYVAGCGCIIKTISTFCLDFCFVHVAATCDFPVQSAALG
jgi:hypothetical protein